MKKVDWIRHLVRRVEEHLGEFTEDERAQIQEAVTVPPVPPRRLAWHATTGHAHDASLALTRPVQTALAAAGHASSMHSGKAAWLRAPGCDVVRVTAVPRRASAVRVRRYRLGRDR
jgi:hypothetical protein